MKFAVAPQAVLPLVLACATIQVAAVVQCGDLAVPFRNACTNCNGNAPCEACVEKILNDGNNIAEAYECRQCLGRPDDEVETCTKCVSEMPSGSARRNRIYECKQCRGQIATECSTCVQTAPSLNHAYQCKSCQHTGCTDCVIDTNDINDAYRCRTLPAPTAPPVIGACNDAIFDFLIRDTEAECNQVIQSSCDNPEGCSCGQTSSGSWAVQRSATCVDKVVTEPPVIGICPTNIFDFLIRDTEAECNVVIQNTCVNIAGCSCGQTSGGSWAVQRSETCIDEPTLPPGEVGACSDAIFDFLIRDTEAECNQVIQDSCDNPQGCSCGQTSGGSWAVQRSATCVEKGSTPPPTGAIGECSDAIFDFLSRPTEAACLEVIQTSCTNPEGCSCALDGSSWKVQRSATCVEA